MNRPRYNDKEARSERVRIFKTHKMGMQIPPRIYPKVSKKSALWDSSQGAGTHVSGIGQAEGDSGRGGTFDGGSCPHDALGTPEILSVAGRRLLEGEERYLDCAQLPGKETELHRHEFLGTRLFRFDRRSGRADGETIHPKSRKGRSALGSVGIV